MKYLLMKKTEGSRYFPNNCNDGLLATLGFYLFDSGGGKHQLDWIKTALDNKFTGGNIFYLHTYANNKIGVGAITFDNGDDPYEFKLTRDELVRIILEYEERKQQSPEMILLTRNGDKVGVKSILSESE